MKYILQLSILLVFFSCTSNEQPVGNQAAATTQSEDKVKYKKPAKVISPAKTANYPLSIKALKVELKLSGSQVKQIQLLNKKLQGQLRNFSKKNANKLDRINFRKKLIKRKRNDLSSILSERQLKALDKKIADVEDLNKLNKLYPF